MTTAALVEPDVPDDRSGRQDAQPGQPGRVEALLVVPTAGMTRINSGHAAMDISYRLHVHPVAAMLAGVQVLAMTPVEHRHQCPIYHADLGA
jgi:hypothetical protein